MNGYSTLLPENASALLAAAKRLEADPSEPASVELLTSTLADVEEALRALSGATHHAADALIPPRRIDETASSRYARAAVSWPDRGVGAPPSYERQAQILTALHDAAATLRAGAECCRRAQDILASTITWQHGRVVLSDWIYSLDRIVQPSVPVHDPAMPLYQGSKRPADNELYDRGCDLVEAAMAIRRLADDPGAERALPALLGCIEAALHELGCAAASMDETSGDAMPTEAMADRMHRGFMNLGLALADAELASTAARGLAGRSLAAASRRRPARDTRPDQPGEGTAAHHSTRRREST